MCDIARVLLQITAADTVAEANARTMEALARLLTPAWMCLLLWDKELGRHTVGATWLDGTRQTDAAQVRRRALRYARLSRPTTNGGLSVLDDGALYQPLVTPKRYVGVCYVGADRPCDEVAETVDLVMTAAAQAIWHATFLERAADEHSQLLADRERLERLLRAVQDQQRVIDRLLATERELSASLEAKVAERTAALQAAQHHLIQSEKLALIGQLASSLAHEVNNPLQAIQSGLGLIELELAQSNTAQAVRDLDVIQAELSRIQTLFRQLLDFYRPVETQCLPLDWPKLCYDVGVLVRKRLQDAGVELSVEIDPDLPLTCGDRNQLKQVLLNLLLNAAEAMEGRGGHVMLRSLVEASHVVLQISDDGPGIEPEDLGRVFEPLFTTKMRGLGLGLAISQEIVQRHGGLITAASTPGEGAVFSVRLPVREVCDEA